MRHRIGSLLVGGLAVAAATPAWGGTTELVSVSSIGEQGDRGSSSPSISADGRFVAFASYATNLVPSDTNSCPLDPDCGQDVFVRDRQTRSSPPSGSIPTGGPSSPA